MYTDILGYKVFNKTKDEFLDEVSKKDKVNIVSGNPEVLYNGLQNETLNANFNKEYSMIIPDGVGTVLASKMVKEPVREKIAGIEVMKEILKRAASHGNTIYLLGAQEEVLQRCIHNLKEELPSLKIVGSHNGYFDLNNCEDIINDIKVYDRGYSFLLDSKGNFLIDKEGIEGENYKDKFGAVDILS